MKRIILLIGLFMPLIVSAQIGRLPYQTIRQSYRGDTVLATIHEDTIKYHTNLSAFKFDKPIYFNGHEIGTGGGSSVWYDSSNYMKLPITKYITLINASGAMDSKIRLVNNSATYRGLTITNNSASYGLELLNNSTGRAIWIDNMSTGQGITLNNMSSSYGQYIFNFSIGYGMYIYNNSTGTAQYIRRYSTGNGITISNDALGNVIESITGGVTTFKVDAPGNVTATKYYVSDLNTAPSSATDTGSPGEIRICSNGIYVCIATNTWVRSSLTTF